MINLKNEVKKALYTTNYIYQLCNLLVIKGFKVKLNPGLPRRRGLSPVRL